MKNGSEKTKKVFAKWRYQEPPYQVGKDGFRFTDLKTDYDGWIDAKWVYPFPYDLVFIKTQEKTKPGWWTGYSWEGLRITPEDVPLYWKQELEVR
jgi:hypothetical protein